MIDTFLFDFDGVLVDTMDNQASSLREAVEKFAINKNQVLHHEDTFHLAITTKEKINYFIANGILPAKCETEVYEMKKKIADKTMMKMKPAEYLDKLEMLKYIKSKDYNVAVVTNANRASTIALLQHLGFLSLVDVVISNNDVANPKPSPEPYFKAIDFFNTVTERSIIFEDSETGLKSALETRCRVVKVNSITDLNVQTIQDLEGGKIDFYSPQR